MKRKTNHFTVQLASFYILNSIGFIFNLILLPINNNPTTTILYFITFYFIAFGLIFLVIFLRDLLNLELNSNLKINLIIVFSYGILLLTSLFLPGGITFNEYTNWMVEYSWQLLLLLYILLTFMIIIPSIIYLKKLNNKIEDKILRKKFRSFTFGIYGMFFSIYGVILYNTCQNPIYKLIWTFFALIVIPSGYLIYKGIGHNL